MIITRLNRSLAKQDPEGTFESPFGIVAEVKRARLLCEIEEARSRLSGAASP